MVDQRGVSLNTPGVYIALTSIRNAQSLRCFSNSSPMRFPVVRLGIGIVHRRSLRRVFTPRGQCAHCILQQSSSLHHLDRRHGRVVGRKRCAKQESATEPSHLKTPEWTTKTHHSSSPKQTISSSPRPSHFPLRLPLQHSPHSHPPP